MLYKILIPAFSVLILASCKPQNNADNTKENSEMTENKSHQESEKQGIVYLKEGENKFLKEYQMNVTFKQMSEDSRCPKDVNCIWAGNATAEVEVMGTATRPMILKLSTMNDLNKGYSKMQNFNRFNISLVEVSPETTSEKGFNALKGQYKIGIKIERAESETTVTTK